MSDKETVEERQQPIANDNEGEMEFIAAIRQGLAELDNGDSVPIEEVEKQLPSWIIR
jgi:predicted transcriptional regulator